MSVKRVVILILIAYAILGAGMLRWHLSHGPPYYQSTFGLLAVFAICGAFVGIMSVWTAYGILHWSKRVSALIAAISILSGACLLFYEWNQFLIWQLIVMLGVQLAALVVTLGIFRLIGIGKFQTNSPTAPLDGPSRLSLRDLFVLTAAFALFFAVMRTAQPIELRRGLYGILVAGGCCAAFAALTAFWVSFSNSGWAIRLVAFSIVAPIGGGVYAIASQYEPLLFNWQWYAGVTTLQMLLMMILFSAARISGHTFSANHRRSTNGM